MSPLDIEEQIKTFLDAHCHEDVIAVALSGGPDSMCLLHCIKVYADTTNKKVLALHVDHQLREESSEEAEHVFRWAHSLGIECVLLEWNHEGITTRIQERARQARYSLMEDELSRRGLQQLCLAHHADDQRETFFMRLKKQSGLNGLCTMRPTKYRGSINLLRPLLNLSKDDILAYNIFHKVPFLKDRSNQNEAYERVRYRHFFQKADSTLLPTTEEITKVTTKLQASKRALDWSVNYFFNQHVKIETSQILLNADMTALPPYLQEKLLEKTVSHLAPPRDYPLPQKKLNNAIKKLGSKKNFVLGHCYFQYKKRTWHIIKKHQRP